MTISPGVVTVCSGDQLEFTCTITDSGGFALLVWNITVFSENAADRMNYTPVISSSSPTNQTTEIMINSTNIAFSRISAQHSSPLISRLQINPVSNHLNGTQVVCVNAMASETSSVAVINISNGNPIQGIIYIKVIIIIYRACTMQMS